MPDHTESLPMGQTPAETPKIKVIFKGLVISRIKHGQPEAMIGALNPSNSAEAPCHKPVVHFYRISPGGETTEIRGTFDIGQDFYLTVRASAPMIEEFWKNGEPFDRFGLANDMKDFRWFVDFNDVHGRTPSTPKVEIQEGKLRPQFRLNRGIFHASSLSDVEVEIVKPDAPRIPFGKFAMEITARILLQGAEVADFRNGQWSYTIPASDANRYEIVFDCTCRAADETQSDFPNIYEAITEVGGGPIRDQISLEKKTTPLLTPEVYCTGGNTFP